MALIDVAAGLVFREGKLLITRRHWHSHLGGLWEFPGGKCEPGESPQDCLVRELREELGIEVTVGELVESLVQEYPGKSVHLHFYHCLWRAREPQRLDCLDFRWVRAEELQQYEFPPADSRLLARLPLRAELWGS